MRYPRPPARGGLCEAGPLLLQFTFREGTFGGGHFEAVGKSISAQLQKKALEFRYRSALR